MYEKYILFLLNGFLIFGNDLLAQPFWLEKNDAPVKEVPLTGITLPRDAYTTISGMLFYGFKLHRGDIPVQYKSHCCYI
jgi:hypothetical protein